ncbi:MAG: tyrosine--tRNA ligase [Actinomycetota bacterium]
MSAKTLRGEELIDDLQWRGLIAQTTDRNELIAALDKGPITLYIGFDPTAPSLHIGSLAVLLVLKRFQLAGHRPIALVGGATGLVGDPSGKSEERTLNDESVVADFVARIRKQVEPYLEFDQSETGALVVNNLDWTAPLSAISFLRDIGKHFSVNQMLAKDSVSTRLNANGISYTEFSYQVLQGFDFLELYRRHNCTLQIGGSDQWGNIIAGLDLIRKVEQGSAHCLTVPLVTKTDGTKFGKTATGTVWLDGELTSPYALYQYWLGVDDRDVISYIKIFTFASRDEVAALEREVAENPGARNAARYLARDVTARVHGNDAMVKVEEVSKALFGQGDLLEVDGPMLAAAAQALPNTPFVEGLLAIDAFAQSGLCDSKSAARRLVKEGGAYINNERVADESVILQKSQLIKGNLILLRKGKRELGAVLA